MTLREIFKSLLGPIGELRARGAKVSFWKSDSFLQVTAGQGSGARTFRIVSSGGAVSNPDEYEACRECLMKMLETWG